MRYDVIVIGGGPAGMMAAGTAAMYGSQVILLEKNEKTGKKLFITGKGRCNVTNKAPISDFLSHVHGNSRFLYSAFSAFNNEDLIEFLEKRGVPTKVERGGRVFPVSDKSSDIVRAMDKYAQENSVLRLKTKVTDILKEKDKVIGVKLENGETIYGTKVIVATGGVSYPQTGSCGDGYRFAKACGHRVVSPQGSLVPLETEEKWPGEAMGLSLKNVSLCAKNKQGKVLYEETGEMLFTHFGVSGPLVLSASAHMRDYQHDRYTITVDLKPALLTEQLDARIVRDFSEEANKDFINALDKLLPKKLIPIIVSLSGIDPRKKVNTITKVERQTLCRLLKNLSVTVKRPRPVAEAIITAGGVTTEEISPKTMESKLVQGLYFAGEVIDLDAYTGGFNLQIAFSTGYLAGQSAAQSLFEVL